MIVIAIVGILSAVAYPAYQDYVDKTYRVTTQGALVAFANAMERHYTEANSYCDAGSGGSDVCGDNGTLDTGVSTIFSPADAGATTYDFKINAVLDNSYTLLQ